MAKPSSSRQDFRRTRILFAEAEPRSPLTTRLLEQEGFEVETAPGADLLQAVDAARYDLVLLDLDLTPDCLTLLPRLERAHAGLPIVVVSIRSELPTKLRCFELGALDYLVKPYAPEELGALIRAHLRMAGGSGGVFRAGRLALDETTRQARIGRKVVDLTEREFQLLHCFVLNAGEVITREQQLAEVWGRTPRLLVECRRRLRSAPAQEAGTGRGADQNSSSDPAPESAALVQTWLTLLTHPLSCCSHPARPVPQAEPITPGSAN